MQTALIVIGVMLLMSSKNGVTTAKSTAAQNGPGTNPLLNIAQGLLSALTRNTTNSAPKSGGGGPGTSGAPSSSSSAGKQSKGNMADVSGDGSIMDGSDGLSSFLSDFPPGTTLGDAATQSGYGPGDFNQFLTDQTGVDFGGAPQPVTSDIGAEVLADGGIPFESTSGDGSMSSGDPFANALGDPGADTGSMSSDSLDSSLGDTGGGGSDSAFDDGGGSVGDGGFSDDFSDF